MAHVRDSNGNPTGRSFITDAQRDARDLYLSRLRQSITIAQENMINRAKRTPEQQIAHLDAKLGKGIGATKERARLLKIIESQNAKPKQFVAILTTKG